MIIIFLSNGLVEYWYFNTFLCSVQISFSEPTSLCVIQVMSFFEFNMRLEAILTKAYVYR